MGLRASSSAIERGTRPRPLRGTIVGRPSSSCAHDNDRLRLAPASPPHQRAAEKKESTDRRPNQACRPCDTPSSRSSSDRRHGYALIAEYGSQHDLGQNDSAKVVLVGQQTQAINALRAHLAEFGIIAGAGKSKVAPLIAIVDDEADTRLPSAARFALHHLAREIERLTDQIKTLEKAIVVATRRDDTARRLTTIPGIGAITAATILALVPDPAGFRASRHFAAWLGPTPKPP